MTNPEEAFDVYIFVGGTQSVPPTKERVGHSLTAEKAILLAKSYSHPQRPANLLGIIARIQIVGIEDDSTVFMWEKGRGIVYPLGAYLQ